MDKSIPCIYTQYLIMYIKNVDNIHDTYNYI